MPQLRMSDQPMTWVFAGDSITQGVFHTHGARSWVEHVHERLRWQLGRLHDDVELPRARPPRGSRLRTEDTSSAERPMSEQTTN